MAGLKEKFNRTGGLNQLIGTYSIERKSYRSLFLMYSVLTQCTQNNFDFGPALEELLYESAPLKSKPVTKRKKKQFEPGFLSSLWDDEHSLNKKKEAALKLEHELEYMDEFFQPYSKEPKSKPYPISSRKSTHGRFDTEDSSETVVNGDQLEQKQPIRRNRSIHSPHNHHISPSLNADVPVEPLALIERALTDLEIRRKKSTRRR